MISALTNASRTHLFHPDEMTPEDEVLGFKLVKLLEQIPYEERRELFAACGTEVALRKEKTQQYHAQQAELSNLKLLLLYQEMKKVIKLSLEETDIALLDYQAKENGITRADLIRHRLFSGTPGRQYTAEDLATLVSRVHRVSNLPRAEVERLVYTVFTAIMSESREAATPVL